MSDSVIVAVGGAAGAIALTIILFVTGLVYPRPVMNRLLASERAARREEHTERMYWQRAALDCANACAALESQLAVARALIGERDDPGPGGAA